MDAKESLAWLRLKLRETCLRGLPRRLFYCQVGPEVPEGGFILPVPRLDIILSGRKKVMLALASGVREFWMEEGDAYYAPPGAWELHRWDSPSEMLCVVARREYLRVSYYRQTDSTIHALPESIYHHTGRRCSEPLRAVLNLLHRDEVAADENGTALHLCRALVGLARDDCGHEPLPVGGSAARRFDQIGTWLENHFQYPISREEVAERFRVSPAYISRVFRQAAGMGFHDYLTRVRLDFARFLLRETDLPVGRIGEQCGFANPVHFIRRFREVEGVAPGQYRQTEKSAAGLSSD